ncbi:lens fiber membrane intrinsic protein-like [Pelodiscus sinensis]|uniref:lens fiber membrane intrinsic protein-like n=1 Tax=Pelodiscus sinensis TaxID=13735 RepID=UPI003F6AD485
MVLLRIASPSLALLSLLLLVVALGSSYWLVIRESGDVIHSGLWKTCVNLRCLVPSTVPDLLNACRVCLTLAVLLGGVSGVALITSFFCFHLGPVSLLLVSAVGSFSTGLLAAAAMAIFMWQSPKGMTIATSRISYGWSFGLGWAACPLFLLTGVVTLLSQGSSTS